MPENYSSLLKTIKERINNAQHAALSKVNTELIMLYWDIGKIIVEQLQQQEWGNSVIEKLALDLQLDYPCIKGFSTRNLWRMRDLYITYNSDIKLVNLLVLTSWTHNIGILEKCKNNLEREFYLRMAHKHGWSSRCLLDHIENQTYERTLLNQTNFDKTLPKNIKEKAKLTVKDEYTFDFLELGDEYTERQFENALTLNIENFLREMGGIFAFIGRQYRLEVDDKEFFVDLSTLPSLSKMPCRNRTEKRRIHSRVHRKNAVLSFRA